VIPSSILGFFLCLAQLQGDSLRAGLEAAYQRVERCARYKFLDGMLAHRGAGFQLFGPDGLNRDLTLERERFQLLLSRATRVRFKTQILKIKPTSQGGHAEVNQSLVVEQVERESNRLFCLVISTRAIDSWQLTPIGWKLTATSVLNQTTSRTGPMEDK
jgi:hypothetical protein